MTLSNQTDFKLETVVVAQLSICSVCFVFVAIKYAFLQKVTYQELFNAYSRINCLERRLLLRFRCQFENVIKDLEAKQVTIRSE